MTIFTDLTLHIESLIFASDRPLTSVEITELINGAFGFMEDKMMPEQIEASLEAIVEKYSAEAYPFEIRQSGGGWQFLTKKEYHKTVAQLNGEKFLKRLSGATLETLAIIAYKQPVTKGEIESIRGVNSDYSVQKLLEKELIVISGRNEAMPGHPLIYNTSKNFMDYFGINSPEDLPKIKEVLANIAVAPTKVNGAEDEEEQAALSVSDNGELVVNEQPETEDMNIVKSDNREATAGVTEEDNTPENEVADRERETEKEQLISEDQNHDNPAPEEQSGKETLQTEEAAAEEEALKAVDETGTDVDDELETEGEEAKADIASDPTGNGSDDQKNDEAPE